MIKTIRTAPYLLLLLLSLLAGAAHAACSDPTGAEGDMLYSGELAALQYCDDTNWIAVNGTVQINKGLVGHWMMRETSGGTLYDTSPYGNDATWNDEVNDDVSEEATTGQYGGALDFDGVDDFAQVPPSASLNNLSAFTYSAWIYPTGWGGGSEPDRSDILQKDGGSREMRLMNEGGQEALRAYIRTSTGAGAADANSVNGTISLYQWQHVVLTYDDGGDRKPRLFKNGVEVSYSLQTALSDPLSDDSSGALQIGAWSTRTRFFDGLIDDVRIYDRALSAAEVQALSDLGDPGLDLDTNLLAYWPMDEGTGATTTVDASGNGNTGTLNNSGWVAGRYGWATDYGSNDYIDVGTTADTALQYPMSVTAWINLNALSQPNHPIISRDGTGSDRQYEFRITGSGGNLNFTVYPAGNGTQQQYMSGTRVFTSSDFGDWHFVSVSVDGAGALKLYIDGVEDASHTVTDMTVPASAANTWIGGASRNSNWRFRGQIDDVRIYDRALTAKEVRAVYKQARLCANPPGIEGDIFFNADEDVLQWCNGNQWVAAGQNPGSPGDAGCSNPSGAEGDLIYNEDYKTPQYCDGTLWQRMGDPCDAASPAPGTMCEDGTVYAGLTPDGNVQMYVARCDHGQTWDGSNCTGSRSSLPWNDGNDPATSNVPVTTNNDDGDGNTAALIGTDSDSVTVGVQPHQAAQACADLSVHGRSDWYLPARNELLDVIYENLVDAIPDDGNPDPIISGFDTAADYYSSSEAIPDTDARWVRFSTGQQFGNSKANAKVFRCARHD